VGRAVGVRGRATARRGRSLAGGTSTRRAPGLTSSSSGPGRRTSSPSTAACRWSRFASTGKVVPRPQRDTDERHVLLGRDAGDDAERAVPAGDADRRPRCRRVPRQLGGVVPSLEQVQVDSAPARFLRELLRRGGLVPRARVDEQERLRQRLRSRAASTRGRRGRGDRLDRPGRRPRCRSACA
jgi:hypothetical protein